jgi:hypothetical protein
VRPIVDFLAAKVPEIQPHWFSPLRSYNSSAPVSSACRIRFRASSGVISGVESPYPNRDGSGLSNVKIFITLSNGEGCMGPEEFVSEDLARKISSVMFWV